MRHFRLLPLTVVLATIIMVMVGGSCAHSSKDTGEGVDSTMYDFPDTLRVATLYSPLSYFIYRETEMGYDYDLVKRLTGDKGIELHLEIAPSLAAAVAMLDSGFVDMIAYEVPVTSEYRDHVLACGVESITHQVLVQPHNSKEGRISDVTQLIGREVYVEKDSKYHHRMENLNRELGGGIIIHPIDRDTLITEDLIEMVSDGEIPLTVVDSDIANINKTYYNDLDITLEVSFPQRASWGVSPSKPWLADSINAWVSEEQPRNARKMLLKRYFEQSKKSPAIQTINFSKGRISPYDNLFRKYAASIGWDWRLIASQGWTESHFDSTLVSWAGARGIMQLMPSTARANGLTPENITNNDANIATAVKIIRLLDNTLKKYVTDEAERRKFVVAAYNSGIAHILDAITIARSAGLDAQKWDGNVEQALLLKSKPEYYNAPGVKYGYFRGRQTCEYVRQVFAFYDKATQSIPI